MANLSDVEGALGVLIGSSLYPTAPGSAEAPSPFAGLPVLVMGGWPTPQALDTMMAAGKGCVSIYAPAGAERNTTRYFSDWSAGPLSPATFTLARAGQTITVGGAGASYPHNLAVTVDGVTYIVQAAAESPATLAAEMAAIIPGATATGATITLSGAARIGSLVVGTGATITREVRRSERQFQISVWAPSPTARVLISDAFDPVLSDTPRLTLADGQRARLTYHSSADDDFSQKQRIFRRNLFYMAEYAVTRSDAATQIVAASETVTNQFGDVLASVGKAVSPQPH